MIQIEFFDTTDKTTFVIFDRDAEKILNKFASDLTKKKNCDTTYFNYCKTIDHNIHKIPYM